MIISTAVSIDVCGDCFSDLAIEGTDSDLSFVFLCLPFQVCLWGSLTSSVLCGLVSFFLDFIFLSSCVVNNRGRDGGAVVGAGVGGGKG